MTKNIGATDKVIRWIIGLVIISAGIYYKSWWGALGVIPLITAMLSWCPLYVPLKINTKAKEGQSDPHSV